jgi:chromosome partitioning protein
MAAPWSFSMAYVAPEAEATSSARSVVAFSRHPDGASTPSGTVDVAQPPSAKPLEACASRVVVLGNGKGGTGKSTIAMHLVAALLRDGHTVASIDLDLPQGTLTRYLENRRAFAVGRGLDLPLSEHHAESMEGEPQRFEALVDRLAQSFDYVVIDTPGRDTPLARQAHARADTLITPINDSFVDLDVLALVEAESLKILGPSHYADMVADADRRKIGRSGRAIDWIVLRNRLSPLDARNKRNVAAVLERLAKRLGFLHGPGLSERVIFRELFLSGLTLLDLREQDTGVDLTLSHVAARQEVRSLLHTIGLPERGTQRKSASARHSA